MCVYMNINIKYYIIMLSHIVLYYIHLCHIHRRREGSVSHGGHRKLYMFSINIRNTDLRFKSQNKWQILVRLYLKQ